MPWFGSSSSVKYSKKRTYYVAGEDGRSRKRASLGRQNEVAPPAGILKRSGRTRSSGSFPFEDGMVPQEMAAAVPMPSEQKVNAMFAEMVVRVLKSEIRAPHAAPFQQYLAQGTDHRLQPLANGYYGY